MDVPLACLLGFALYVLHELDEIALIGPWSQRVARRPASDARVQRRREADTFARRYRSLRGETSAVVILAQTVLIAVMLVAVASFGVREAVVAVLAVHALHLLGHVAMAVSARAVTPGSVTAVVTLPAVALVAASAAAAPLDGWLVAGWGAAFGVAIAVELALLQRAEPPLSRWLDRYAGAEALAQRASPGTAPVANGSTRRA